MSLLTPSAHQCSKGGSTLAPLHWGSSSREAAQAPARGPLLCQGPAAPPGAPGPIPPELVGPLGQTQLEKWPGVRRPRAAARERAQVLGQRSRGLWELRLSTVECGGSSPPSPGEVPPGTPPV
eukprot:1436206-Amphidinium_carterae.1